MRKTTFSLLILLLLLLSSCKTEPAQTPVDTAEPLIHIQLPMGYIPDPQYAPFYVALDKGYYAEAGFDVTFDYSFETDGMALVGANKFPFALVSGEQVLLARAQELPVVYVMEWFQRFPIAIVSQAESGIKTPADLQGRTVGLPGFFGASYVGYAGLLFANGLAQEDVIGTEIGFTQVESLLTGQVDAAVGYANNEPVQLLSRGEDINVIYVADFIDMVANGLITNEETITNNPEMVTAFVGATLKGVADTLADPAAAFSISQKYVEGLDESRMAVLTASLELWQADQLGYTDPASWKQTEMILLEMGLLEQPVENLDNAYSNDFIK